MMLYDKNLILYILIFSCITFSACTKDSPSNIQKESFIKSFGEAYDDKAIDFVKDNGNYYILGDLKTKNDPEETRICLIKTDEFGNSVWDSTKRYTIEQKNSFGGQIVKLNDNNGYAVIGSIEMDSDSLYMNSFLFIINNDGEVLQKVILSQLDTTVSETNETGTCIGQFSNGNLIVGINITDANNNSYISSYFLILNAELEVTITKPYTFEVHSLCKRNSDQGYFALGKKDGIPVHSIIHPTGVIQSINHKNIQGEIYSIVENSSGELFICGEEDTNGNGKSDGYIAKLSYADKSNTDWKTYFNNSEIGKNGRLNYLQFDSGGNLLIVGSIQNTTSDDNYDIWVLNTDRFGRILSEEIIGGSHDEKGVKIVSNGDNSFTLQATTSLGTNSMITLLKSSFE